MTTRRIRAKAENPSGGTEEDRVDLQNAIASLTDGAGAGTSILSGIVSEVFSDPQDYMNRLFYVGSDVAVSPFGTGAAAGGGNKEVLVSDVYSGRVKKDAVTDTNFSTLFSNPAATDVMPVNSCAAYITEESSSGTSSKPYLCFPFFPPHLSLPLKPGEHVWIIKEGRTGGDAMFYWMCRKVGFRQIDDINITHLERTRIVSNQLDTTKSSSPPLTDTTTNVVNNFESAAEPDAFAHNKFDDIHQKSIAYREEFTGEPVPRQAKKCGDLLIQGSNNAHIMLGTEKFKTARLSTRTGGSYTAVGIDPTNQTTKSSAADTLSQRMPVQPAIDICLFRKSRELFELRNTFIPGLSEDDLITETPPGGAHASLGTGLGAVKGKRSPDGSRLEHFETDKTRELNSNRAGDLFNAEFYDSDIYNVIGRIYMSNLKTIDELLLLEPWTGGGAGAWGTGPGIPEDMLGLGNFGSTVVIGPNTRLIGTESVKIQQIANQGLIQISQDGSIILAAGTGGNGAVRGGGAKIILTAGGDIKLIPSQNGYIHAGTDFDDVDEGKHKGIPALAHAGPPIGPHTFHGHTAHKIVTNAGGELDEKFPPSNEALPLPNQWVRYSKKVLMW